MKEITKIRNRNIVFLTAALIMSGLLTACESSEVETSNNLAKYEKVLVQIADEAGNPRFLKNKSTDVAVLGCSTEEMAQGFVKGLSLGEYKGDEFTTLDMGNYGAVLAKRLADKEQFFQVEVRLKDYETTRLFLVSESYLRNLLPDNGDIGDMEETQVYICSNCQSTFAYPPEMCPICLNVPMLTLVPIPSFSIDRVNIDFGLEVNNNK